VCKIVEKEGFDFLNAWKNNLKKSDLENVDFVISIGGDGTALTASHYLTDKPLLAVNSNPGKSEGALTTLNIDELEKKLDEIKDNKHKIEKLERIEVLVNGKKIDFLALNEVFIANEKAYLISKYKLKYRGNEEEQRSSGLIFATGAGSTAWFRSAGGVPFESHKKFIKLLVREPYFGRLGKFKLLKADIKENEEIEIFPMMDSVLAIDSIREIKLKEGDRVKIKISDSPLERIR
jgi:NAD kinase